MFHQQIKLPEKHPDHPTLFKSTCGQWRIIRCKDDLQFIVQRYRNAKKIWEGKSYHVYWNSISLIHGHKAEFKTLTQPIWGGSDSCNVVKPSLPN